MAQKQTLADKLVARLRKFGLSERKARAMAKGLVPTVRSAVKAEERAKSRKIVIPKAGKAEDDSEEDPATTLTGKAVKVNGVSLRLDLPVCGYEGKKGVELLQVMNGLSSTASYLVAAVKGEEGIVAIRKLGEDTFNVKFYPNMRFWGYDEDTCRSLGAAHHLQRQPYERMHFPPEGVEQLMGRLEAAAKPKSRMKALADRLRAVTFTPLTKAFTILYSRAFKSVA